MSGALCAVTAMGAATLPPLTCDIQITFSSGTDNVSGGNNDLYTWSSGNHLVGVGISGGSGSYTSANVTFVSDGNQGGATCAMILSGDGVHNTIAWTSLPVGNSCFYHLTFDVTDSLGNTASARWPSAGSAEIHRTS